MKRLVLLPLLLTLALMQSGCGTSCGRKEEPQPWADGITREVSGTRVYESTPVDGLWLHFPSYRKFKFVHGFGTKDLSVEAYVSLAEDEPAKTGDATKVAIASSAEVLATFVDENTVVVENTTCENDYYLFVRISERRNQGAGTAGATSTDSMGSAGLSSR
ncbi:MAG TPA: hypothetical protein VKP30_05745 [Polyangiaceae bacterium]|nr:hypothetical protein [Polyangiaceae bacterium]